MADADTAIRPYRVDIPQAALDDLAGRLSRAQWPDELPGATGSYGMTTARVRDLAGYWRDEFDWRAVEARLNSHPQFVTDIDGEAIHFLHVRSSRADATPLLLTHGWPGSVLEDLDLIAPLAGPDGAGAPALHLLTPSLPGRGPLPARGGRGRAGAPPRLRPLRCGRQRCGLDDLPRSGPDRPGARPRGARHPAVLVPGR